MSTNTLQGTLFGGFQRKGVIAYIEKAAREHTEQLAAKDEVLAGKDKELLALKEENEHLCAEITQLKAEIESLHGEVDAFRAIKEHLTELQMEAVRCAKEIECNARARAEKTESVAYARIRAVNRESKTRFDESFAFVDDLLNATARENKETTAE